GNRYFNKWIVAFCITGLFSGSTYISILEMSYLKGISAFWYGVAEIVQIFIIAFLIIRSFRKKMLVTVSGLIGDKYGRASKGIALSFSVAFTAVLLFVYLQAGGMWSIAFTLTINIILFTVMIVIGAIAFLINPGIDGLREFAGTSPEMFHVTNAGLQVIIVWFGTFLVNVILAQAAFQMALSSRTPEEGQKGLIISGVLAVPFIIGGVLFGVSAAIVVPDAQTGLIA